MQCFSGGTAQPADHSADAENTMVSLAPHNCSSSAEQPAAPLRSNVKWDAATAHKKILRSASSAAQPAPDSAAAELDSAICRESVLLIVRYVGAHNLETVWPCSKCNPYWYDWYCHECRLVNKYLYWSPRLHFGHCGQSCGCCRSEKADFGACEACDDLLNLKRTCHTMRDLLKTYNGR